MQAARSDDPAQTYSAMLYWKAEAARRKAIIAELTAEMNRRGFLLKPVTKAFSADAEKALAEISAAPLAPHFKLCAGQSASEFDAWLANIRSLSF